MLVLWYMSIANKKYVEKIFQGIAKGNSLKNIADGIGVSSVSIHKKINKSFDFPRKKAEALLLKRKITDTPIDIGYLISCEGVTVEKGSMPASVDGFFDKEKSGFKLLVNDNLEESGIRYLTAHVLGHIILKHTEIFDQSLRHIEKTSVINKNNLKEYLMFEEAQANIFAENLLIPDFLLKKELVDWTALRSTNIKDLADFFCVPEFVMVSQLKNVNYI